MVNVELQYATGQDLKDGWILSVDFLKTIQEQIRQYSEDDMSSLEQIETTLIAFHRYSNSK